VLCDRSDNGTNFLVINAFSQKVDDGQGELFFLFLVHLFPEDERAVKGAFTFVSLK
jgi:hypothetical protein